MNLKKRKDFTPKNEYTSLKEEKKEGSIKIYIFVSRFKSRKDSTQNSG